MSSDYSRLIFDRKKHYSAVRMQQGRVLLDSDWNAQSDLYQDRLHKQTVDVIGKTGVPIHSNGFQLALHSASELSISTGRIYVNGLLCELDDKVNFGINNEGVLIPSGGVHLPYGFIHTKMDAGRFLLYLEAWQREITFLDDPQIREKALGDPDTTTRLQTTWQLKAAHIDDGVQCEDIQIPSGNIGGTSTGTLEARTVSSDTSTDPCSFNQTGGFRRLENQLYRIEIQTGGNLSESTFKWSRENASVASNVLEITGSDVVKVNSLGRDEVLGFSVGDWVEFKNHKTSLGRTVHNLVQIEGINRNTMEISVSASVDGLDVQGLKVVRWDQSNENIPLSSSFVQIEDGVEVNFSTGTYTAGDYWLIPARTIDSSIEWPLEERKLPKGVHVSYAKIGVVAVEDGEIESITDCRNLFPPLTELPKTGGGCCTYHVSPEAGWERVFDHIKENEDAKICFDIGVYTLESTVNIKNKGHLLITGCGQGTIIQATKLQVAFRIDGCNSVDISHMAFKTNQVKNQDKDDVVSRKGAVTVVNTPSLSIDKLHISCGHGRKPQASCISYYNTEQNPGAILVTNCKLNVGFYQHGLVIVNSKRSVVENNLISMRLKPESFTVRDRIKKDNRTRKAFMEVFMSNISEKSNSNTNETVRFGNQSLSFRTNSDLRNAKVWHALIKKNPPSDNISTIDELKKHLQLTVLKYVHSKDNKLPELSKFVDLLSEQDPSVGFQGIVIGGKVSTDVHVIRNRIEDFLQGIHIGLSHQDNSREDFDIINTVKIEKNFVRNTLPLLNNYARHGIFVGNCERLFIDNNQLDLNRMTRANKVPIHAIKVWGVLGRKGTITNNDIYSTSRPANSYHTGIRINKLRQSEKVIHWNITWNSIIATTDLDVTGNFFDSYLDTNL
ncbi:hypothetical protein ES711_10535 [Gelidibacter salicanalis]|uniref:Right-handed parallel beta-helix repeat-containing protein n=1 Tax=Gelidibacter salicanalis TaxID=291193 RepID=A0A5C7AGQ3_9FLAO|nr:DUF6519 domain-containing protein [Gelidibacter salicanalis]TXE07860.1 hypothetical protein ES711_10535 [Gelidibacter salicanalis]